VRLAERWVRDVVVVVVVGADEVVVVVLDTAVLDD